MGADPTPFIEQAARKLRINLNMVSMGQGQEVYARRLLKSAVVDGTWILLQNCHLCTDYIQELFELLASMGEISHRGSSKEVTVGEIGGDTGGQAEAAGGGNESGGGNAPPTVSDPLGSSITKPGSVHEQFRLWVTTEEHRKFPINFLQIAIKFTNEPPEGIKANLTRTYLGITQDFLEICVTNHWRIMLYSLAYLHCTVQERRKYGPLGWCIPYEFNQSDFNASVQFLQNHLDSLQFKKGQKISVSLCSLKSS